jgi:hypothetical protein
VSRCLSTTQSSRNRGSVQSVGILDTLHGGFETDGQLIGHYVRDSRSRRCPLRLPRLLHPRLRRLPAPRRRKTAQSTSAYKYKASKQLRLPRRLSKRTTGVDPATVPVCELLQIVRLDDHVKVSIESSRVLKLRRHILCKIH